MVWRAKHMRYLLPLFPMFHVFWSTFPLQRNGRPKKKGIFSLFKVPCKRFQHSSYPIRRLSNHKLRIHCPMMYRVLYRVGVFESNSVMQLCVGLKHMVWMSGEVETKSQSRKAIPWLSANTVISSFKCWGYIRCLPFSSHLCPIFFNHILSQPSTARIPCAMPAISPFPPPPSPISRHFPPFPHFPDFFRLQNTGSVSS